MSRERGAGDDLGAVVRTVSWMLWLRGETSESFNCLFKATNFRKFVIPEQKAFLQEGPEKMSLKMLTLAIWGESSKWGCLLISLWGGRKDLQRMERSQGVTG